MQKEAIQFEDTATAFASKSNSDLHRAHFLFATMSRPWLVSLGTMLTQFALALRLPVKWLIRKTLFNHFCGGETIKDCQKRIDELSSFDVHTILDYSVEGASNEVSYDDTRDEIVRVAQFSGQTPSIPFCVVKMSGIGSIDLMAKKQAGEKLEEEEQAQMERIYDRLDVIAAAAKSSQVRFMIDAEESWIQDVVDRMVYDLMRKYNQDGPWVYNTYQMYRHDMLNRLNSGIAQAKKEGYFIGAKLVRGAYMEKERERATEMGYESPIHETKEDTDSAYNAGMRSCMDHLDFVALCAGTHNEDSARMLAEWIDESDCPRSDERIYFAQLLGMSDNISFALSKMGFNVAKYVPYGPVRKVLPYLFRRAEENTSIAGQTGREFSLIKQEIQRRKQS